MSYYSDVLVHFLKFLFYTPCRITLFLLVENHSSVMKIEYNTQVENFDANFLI